MPDTIEKKITADDIRKNGIEFFLGSPLPGCPNGSTEWDVIAMVEKNMELIVDALNDKSKAFDTKLLFPSEECNSKLTRTMSCRIYLGFRSAGKARVDDPIWRTLSALNGRKSLHLNDIPCMSVEDNCECIFGLSTAQGYDPAKVTTKPVPVPNKKSSSVCLELSTSFTQQEATEQVLTEWATKIIEHFKQYNLAIYQTNIDTTYYYNKRTCGVLVTV